MLPAYCMIGATVRESSLTPYEVGPWRVPTYSDLDSPTLPRRPCQPYNSLAAVVTAIGTG
jgi:hypothetical protein